MNIVKHILALSLMIVLFQSCIKQVTVDTRSEKPILVVEGSITTDSVPYTVRLSYSGSFVLTRDIPEAAIEKDATIFIEDDMGNSTPLMHVDSGLYQTTDPNYIGKVGRSYHIDILLKNGTRYVSKPELIKSVQPIAKVAANFVNEFNIVLPTYLDITIDTKDPADEENYYQWKFFAYTMRQTRGVPCGFQCINFQFCYQNQIDNEIRILSDQNINGNLLRNQSVGRTYIYTYGNPYTEIYQYSISRESYLFWQRYQDQLARTGSILDPLPAAIRGNVYNASDSTDFVLGYFSASSVVRRKVIFIPFSITEYLLDISARNHIPPQFIACFDYYANALSFPDAVYPPPPPGWENAERIEVRW